jgi:hypothetical protein
MHQADVFVSISGPRAIASTPINWATSGGALVMPFPLPFGRPASTERRRAFVATRFDRNRPRVDSWQSMICDHRIRNTLRPSLLLEKTLTAPLGEACGLCQLVPQLAEVMITKGFADLEKCLDSKDRVDALE